MLYFLYGEDSYRSKEKLEEIISGYKEKHKSGLNLLYIDTKEKDFSDFYNNFKITSMFDEKKLIILKNVFGNAKFQEELLENLKNIEEKKDIVVVYEDTAADKRTKLFRELEKKVKSQEFNFLQPAMKKKWVLSKFSALGGSASGGEKKTYITPDALDLLTSFIKNDLWQMANEINKLSNYKMGSVVKREDVLLCVKPGIESDIFKTIDALASKNKKQALNLLHKHLDEGEAPLYLLSMIAYQFKNLLILKELIEKGLPYQAIIKKSGLHPFVVQKTYYACSQFSLPELKKIYRKVFQVDSDIKTGKIDAETSLDLLVSEI